MSAYNPFDWRNQSGENRPATATLDAFNPNRRKPAAGSNPITLPGSRLSNTASITQPAFVNRPRNKK